jgi:hypothetical protein
MTKPLQSNDANRPVSAQCIDSVPAEAVTDLDYGRYLVISASASVCVLDVGPESSSLVRSPQPPTVREREAVPLRRDGETLPLLGTIQLQLRRRAVFRIDVRGDGIETTTMTTPLCVIRRLTE